jgi:hypothetical protein
MDAIIILLLAVTALIVFDALALAFGVDSRDDSADPRRPAYPIALD